MPKFIRSKRILAETALFSASVSLSQGNEEEAEKRLHIYETQGTHYYRGLLSLRRGRIHKAEESFNKELSRQPFHAKALLCRAVCHYLQDRREEASEDLAKWTGLDQWKGPTCKLIQAILLILTSHEVDIRKITDPIEIILKSRREVWWMSEALSQLLSSALLRLRDSLSDANSLI